MIAVVLVGGAGTRLRPLTLTTPKQLLPIAEVPMIERVLGHLAGHGVEKAVLSMGYRPDAFLAAFPGDRCAGVALTYAVEPEPLDTAGAIAFAARHASVADTFLAVNGDVLTDLDVGSLVEFHRQRAATATIHLTPVEDPSAYGVVLTAADGRVVSFIEKPAAGEVPTNLVNAGTYVLEPSVVDRIPAEHRVSIERDTFPALVAEGKVFAMASAGYWLDAGTPATYLRANLDAIRRATPPAPGARRGDSGVWTVGRPVIDGDLIAPALVGDAAFVAGEARVEDAVVGAGARVLAGARVTRSVLLPGAVVGARATVTGAVVGEGAAVAESTTVAEGCLVAGGSRVE